MARRFGWGRRYTLQDTDKDPALQSFVLTLSNPTGTQIQHAIVVGVNTATLPDFSWKVQGASKTATNTPSVAAGVAFAAGVGIVAALTNEIMFDVPNAYVDSEVFGIAVVSFNTTGTPHVMVSLTSSSNNVNGVTLNRPALYFFVDDGAATPFNLTNANLPAGKVLNVRVLAALR